MAIVADFWDRMSVQVRETDQRFLRGVLVDDVYLSGMLDCVLPGVNVCQEHQTQISDKFDSFDLLHPHIWGVSGRHHLRL